MHSRTHFTSMFVGSLALLGFSAFASAQSYTMAFEDLLPNSTNPYDTANVLPANYAPPELAGSGITVTFQGYDPQGVPTSVPLFYGHPITTTNDHTDYGVGGNIYNVGSVELTFSQPVYMTSVWLDEYWADGSNAQTLADTRPIHVTGYTNATDTEPAITASVACPSHLEPWRDGVDELVWRDMIAFGDTPVTRITFNAWGNVMVDDITISTTPVTPLFGDFNRNGEVDDGDYTIWADTYDTWTNPDNIGLPYDVFGVINHGVDLRADANGNGYIDDGDYTVWADTYGQTNITPSGTVTVIPEPASMGLLALGGMALLARRRK